MADSAKAVAVAIDPSPPSSQPQTTKLPSSDTTFSAPSPFSSTDFDSSNYCRRRQPSPALVSPSISAGQQPLEAVAVVGVSVSVSAQNPTPTTAKELSLSPTHTHTVTQTNIYDLSLSKADKLSQTFYSSLLFYILILFGQYLCLRVIVCDESSFVIQFEDESLVC